MIVHHILEIEKEVNLQDTKGVTMRILVGPRHGAPNFHMRHFTIEPSGHTPLHKHPWEHEIYVLSGKGTVLTGEEHADLTKGISVFIPSGITHQIHAGDTELEFLCMIPAPEKA